MWMPSIFARIEAGTSAARVSGGAAGLLRADPDGVEPPAERVPGQRRPRPATGAQPVGWAGEQDLAGWAPVVRETGDEAVERGGSVTGRLPRSRLVRLPSRWRCRVVSAVISLSRWA